MKQKIFDDFQTVSCNECSHYWDSSCDGVYKGSNKPCKTFLATRRVDIPQQIKALNIAFRWLTIAVIIELILIVVKW